MADINDWNNALEDMKKADEERNASLTQSPEKKKSGGKGLMVVLVGLVFIIAIGGVVATTLMGNPPQETQAVPGDPLNFDAPASLQAVQEFAGDDVRFLEVTMDQVRSDGTMNLNADYAPSTDYLFVRGKDNGQGDNSGYEYVMVSIRASTNGNGMSKSTQAVPAEDMIPARVVPPNCSIEQLWQSAKTYNVPDNGVAFIHYTVDGYNFVVEDLDIDLQFNEDCILVRS